MPRGMMVTKTSCLFARALARLAMMVSSAVYLGPLERPCALGAGR